MFTIAICDDRPLCRQLLMVFIHLYEEEKRILFDIHQFCSGEELLEGINKHSMVFDLIFLDNSMKKLTGLETAKQIRQFDSMSACNIVFVTSEDDHEQFKQVQPLQVVCKPGSQEGIGAILEEITSGQGD